MSQTFGIEAPGGHVHAPYRQPARYLVVIEAAGSMIARLFLATRELVAEFDAGVEEVAVMTRDLVPSVGATGAEWDHALAGHSAVERSAALVYTLDI